MENLVDIDISRYVSWMGMDLDHSLWTNNEKNYFFVVNASGKSTLVFYDRPEVPEDTPVFNIITLGSSDKLWINPYRTHLPSIDTTNTDIKFQFGLEIPLEVDNQIYTRYFAEYLLTKLKDGSTLFIGDIIPYNIDDIGISYNQRTTMVSDASNGYLLMSDLFFGFREINGPTSIIYIDGDWFIYQFNHEDSTLYFNQVNVLMNSFIVTNEKTFSFDEFDLENMTIKSIHVWKSAENYKLAMFCLIENQFFIRIFTIGDGKCTFVKTYPSMLDTTYKDSTIYEISQFREVITVVSTNHSSFEHDLFEVIMIDLHTGYERKVFYDHGDQLVVVNAPHDIPCHYITISKSGFIKYHGDIDSNMVQVFAGEYDIGSNYIEEDINGINGHKYLKVRWYDIVSKTIYAELLFSDWENVVLTDLPVSDGGKLNDEEGLQSIPTSPDYKLIGTDGKFIIGDMGRNGFITCTMFLPFHPDVLDRVMDEGVVSYQKLKPFEDGLIEFYENYEKDDERRICLNNSMMFSDLYGALIEKHVFSTDNITFMTNLALCAHPCLEYKDDQTIFGSIIHRHSIKCINNINNTVTICNSDVETGKIHDDSAVTVINDCGQNNNNTVKKSVDWVSILIISLLSLVSLVIMILFIRKLRRTF